MPATRLSGAVLLHRGVTLLGAACLALTSACSDPMSATSADLGAGADLAGGDASTSTDQATPECPSPQGESGVTLNLSPVTLTGKLLVAGGPSASQARLQLRGSGGDQINLGALRDGSYQVSLLPGSYDLFFVNPGVPDGAVAPSNSNARLRADVAVKADGRLDIDVPMTTLRGAVTVNGQRPGGPLRPLKLVSSDGQGSVYVTPAADGSYSVPVIPGKYDVFYDDYAPLRRAAVVDGAAALDVDIALFTVRGKITVAGAAASGTGALLLRQLASGSLISLGPIGQGQFQRDLVGGRYDVIYRGPSDPNDLSPRGGGVLRAAVDLTSGGTLDIDIPTIAVTGQVTVAGALLPGRAGLASGNVTLQDSQGARSPLASTADGAYARRVVPGRYQILYGIAPGTPAPGLPLNSQVTLRTDVDLGAAGPLNIDVPVARLAGKLTLGGKVAASTLGEVLLLDAAYGRLSLGLLGDGSYSVTLAPGRYQAAYAARSIEGLLPGQPGNTLVPLGEQQVSGDATLNLDVPLATELRGHLTLGAAPVPAAPGAQLYLLSRPPGDSLPLGALTPAGFRVNALPGVYDVYYLSNPPLPAGLPGNIYARIGCVTLP